MTELWILTIALLLCACASAAPTELAPPVVDGIWLRPAAAENAEPTIGFKDGMRISLWPTRGPRGLIRICAPTILPKKPFPILNFIAIEPISDGVRFYSELEHGADGQEGKNMWLSDCLASGRSSKPHHARGIPGTIKSGDKTVRTLSAVVNIEPYINGTQPQVQVLFREDRPDEVGFRVHATPGSARMDSCVLTATMGNYSRARLLWLKDSVADSRELWPGFDSDGFTDHKSYPLSDLTVTPDGARTAFITTNEKSLKDIEVPAGAWNFDGEMCTQYWRKYRGKAHPKLIVQVNGRSRYWGSPVSIPGGVSFENFELVEPYVSGQESWFGATTKTPAQLGRAE